MIRNRQLRDLHSFSFSLLSVILFAASPAIGKASDGWRMEQRTEDSGRAEVWLSSNGIKIHSQLLSALVMPPRYNAIMYNERTRKFVDVPYKDWVARYKTGKRNITGPVETGKIAGLAAKKYISLPGKNPHKKVEIWTTTALGIDRQLSDFFARRIGIPPELGLPLRLVAIYDNKPSKVELDTISVKKMPVPISTYKPPTGFKQVSSEMELLLDVQGTDDLGSVLK